MDSLKTKQVRLEQMLPIIQRQLEAGQSVRFSPRGISMLPMLRQGRDSVMLSPLSGKLQKYDLPLYRRDDGKFVLHRIVRVGESYTCVGDNQFYLEEGVEQRHLIAVVTAFYRDEKEISVKNPMYQLYCRFWHYSRPIRHIWHWGWNLPKRVIRKLKNMR